MSLPELSDRPYPKPEELRKIKPAEIVLALRRAIASGHRLEELYLRRHLVKIIGGVAYYKVPPELEHKRDDIVKTACQDVLLQLLDENKSGDRERLLKYFWSFVGNRSTNAIYVHEPRRIHKEWPIAIDTSIDVPDTEHVRTAEMHTLTQQLKGVLNPKTLAFIENGPDPKLSDRQNRRNRNAAMADVRKYLSDGFMNIFAPQPSIYDDPVQLCLFMFEMHYTPGDGATLEQWCVAIPQYAEKMREYAALIDRLPTDDGEYEMSDEELAHLEKVYDRCRIHFG